MVTIGDVAAACGVSATTVSHVLNNTRFVRPETAKLVLDTVKKMRYVPLRQTAQRATADQHNIGFIVDRTLLSACGCRSFVGIADDSGWITLAVHNSVTEEELLQYQKRFHLDLLLVHSSVEMIYGEHRCSGLSKVVLINQSKPPADFPAIILSIDYSQAVSLALEHLLNCGHCHIKVLIGKTNDFSRAQIKEAVRRTMAAHQTDYSEEMISRLDLPYNDSISKNDKKDPITAVISVGTMAIQAMIRYCGANEINLPLQLSAIAVDDDGFAADFLPAITRVSLDCTVFRPSLHGCTSPIICSPQIVLKESTACLPRDPSGKKAATPRSLELSFTEENIVKRKSVTVVGVSFMDGSTMFSRLIAQGIKEVCTYLGMVLLPMMDARNDSDLEQMQVEQLEQQQANVIISVSNDHHNMTDVFLSLARHEKTHLLLGAHLPPGLPEYAYDCCIATDDVEKGRLAAKLLAEQMSRRHYERAALLYTAQSNFAAEQCDLAASSTLARDYRKIQVVLSQGGIPPERSASVLEKLCLAHPEMQGAYIHNADVALQMDQCLKKIGRSDLVLVTSQINTKIAQMLASGETNLSGIISSHPYQMGRSMGLAAAGITLGKKLPKYVSVPPVVIHRDNIQKAWPMLTQNRL